MSRVDVEHRGIFVSIEGIDGSGKSTLAKELELLGEIAGKPVYLIGKNSPIGVDYVARHADGLRELLWREQTEHQRGGISDLHWLWLAASWFALVEQIEIENRVRDGAVVISDSWFDKILARFSLKASSIVEQAHAVSASLRRPDITVMLDVAPELAADRKCYFGYSECGNFDGLIGRSRENFVHYQGLVRREYLRLANAGGWATFETPVTANDIARLVIARLEQR